MVFDAPAVYTGSAITSYSQKYEPSNLQATAAKVKFAALQAEYTIEVTRDGGEYAAVGSTNGRKYNVVVKDKAGNLAKNEVVNVAFNEDLDRVISTNTKSEFIKVNTDGTQSFYSSVADASGNTNKKISIKTNDKGEASFIIGTATGNINDYATPVAWIDVNTAYAIDGSLDEGEPKTVATTTIFVAPYLDGASLKSYKSTNLNKAVTEFVGTDVAVFRAVPVNQSGKTFAGATIKTVTYTVTNTGSNNISVEGQTVSPNRSYSVTLLGSGATTNLHVTSLNDKNASVKVVATGVALDGTKEFAFTSKEATATFKSSTAVLPTTTYAVAGYDADAEELIILGKDAISYAEDDVLEYRNQANVVVDYNEFARLLSAFNVQRITYSENADGKVILAIAAAAAGSTTNVAGKAYVTNVTATPASTNVANTGYLVLGDKLDIEVTVSEAIDLVTVAPTLALTSPTGGTVAATYNAAKSTATKLVFTYTVAASNAGSTVTLGAIAGTITPVDTNKAFADTLSKVSGSAFAYIVDTTAPDVDGMTPVVVTHTAGSANLIAGETVAFKFSEVLSASSAADVKAAIEAAIGTAGDVVVTTTDNQTFTATVQAGKTVNAGTAITVDVDATKVIDLAGNAAGTTGNVTFTIPVQS